MILTSPMLTIGLVFLLAVFWCPSSAYPVLRRDITTTHYIYTSTNVKIVTNTIHATYQPTPSSEAASLSSAIASETANDSDETTTTETTSSSAEFSSSSAAAETSSSLTPDSSSSGADSFSSTPGTSSSSTDSTSSSPTDSTSSSAESSSSVSSSSSSATSSSSSTSSPSSGSAFAWPNEAIYGVNLGGWLVLEPWINTDLFSDSNFPDGTIPQDEFDFCGTLGDSAGDLLEEHYSSWITEEDFSKMKSYGLNAVRIPVGYWAYKIMSTDKYYKGSQDEYLEKAIGWAKNNGMYVLIDLHGAPGSQNGYDSSGHKNYHDWDAYDNTDQTVEILKTIFEKYSSDEYKGTVIGIELVNEPLIGGDGGVSQSYVSDFYSKVIDAVDDNKGVTPNIVLHDGYMYQGAWSDESYNSKENVLYDTHLYMLFDHTYIEKSFDDKIKQVCTWGDEIGVLSYREIVGEFTAAFDANSSSIYTEKIDKWGQDDKDKLRKFVEAQITAFEKSAGWFFWNWKMGNSDQWDFQILADNDIIPQPLSDRRFTTC